MPRIRPSSITKLLTLASVFALIGIVAPAPLAAHEGASQQSPAMPRQRSHPPFPPLPPGYIRPPMSVRPGNAPKMKVEILSTVGSATYRITFGQGDEVMSGLYQFAEQKHIASAYIMGIGGLSSAELGWGSDKVPGMKEIHVDQKCELVSLMGGISEFGRHPYVHLHAVVAFSDGSTKGGHVIALHVNPIVEIYMVTTKPPMHQPSIPEPAGR